MSAMSTTSPTGWLHGSELCVALEELHQASELARQRAHHVLRFPEDTASSAVAMARACALEHLQHLVPQVERHVADVLGYSNLWRSSGPRLRRLVTTANEEGARRDLAQGLLLLLQGARTRLAAATGLERHPTEQLARLRPVPTESTPAPSEPEATLEAFTQSIARVATSAGNLHRIWASLVADLDEATTRLESGDSEAGPWLAERLGPAEFGWRRTYTSARGLQLAGAQVAPLPSGE